MFSQQEHLDNLIRHVDLVRDNCLLLGRRLIASGRGEFGRMLIARGHVHDHTKFSGIEWEYLHRGPEVPADKLDAAILQHVRTNDHHPEFWAGVENMPDGAVAEMVCDWYARAQEFGTDLRSWITQQAVERFRIADICQQRGWINSYVDTLLKPSFR